MDLRGLRSNRGGLSPLMMIIIAAGVIAAAALLYIFTREHTYQKKAEYLGVAGKVSTFKMDRHEGINLPIADQAAAGTVSADTVMEMPLEWGKDAKTCRGKLEERYDAICKKLPKPEGIQAYDDTITLKADRDLFYRDLILAVLVGQDRGFLKYQVACTAKADSPDVRYLKLDLPTEPPAEKSVLLLRVVKDGPVMQYVFGISQTRIYNRLDQAMQVMKNTMDKMGKEKLAGKVFVLQPSLEVSVQNVIEVLNAMAYAGCPRITLANVNIDKIE